MKLRIQAINFDATTTLESFVGKKVARLEKNYDEIVNVEVYLKVVKPETATNKEAEIKIKAANAEFFAAKVADTFEQAIDECVDALDKQIKKQKDKY